MAANVESMFYAREELQSLFCLKINVEYKKFKEEQLSLSIESIYENAYQIHTFMCMYENLLEMSQKFSEDVLVSLITYPELLAYLYERWLKVEDSLDEELTNYMRDEIYEIHGDLFIKEGRLIA
jgi:hypothetical protein